MRLDTSQQMRTDMRLKMAPRMIQSMEILQLPLMALQERIDQELSENPVLVDLREAPSSESESESEEAPASARSRQERRRIDAGEDDCARFRWPRATASIARGASARPTGEHDAMENARPLVLAPSSMTTSPINLASSTRLPRFACWPST